MRSGLLVLAAGAVLSACALKGDVRRVETQVEALRADRAHADSVAARADSARAVEVARVIRMLRAVQESLGLEQHRLVLMEGGIRSDLTDVQRQLVQVQELTGQSQQRLTELRSQLEQRSQTPLTAGASAAPPDTTAATEQQPGPEQLYDISLQNWRRGSTATARLGFQKFLSDYPKDDRAPDAEYFLGETWAGENADSAAAAYRAVVKNFPDSKRAASSLYKLGLLAEQRGDRAGARVFYARVVAGYPQSQEAALARDKLRAQGH